MTTIDGTPVQGVRVHDRDPSALRPGEYARHPITGCWYANAPHSSGDVEFLANLQEHEVIEHEDGTITVSPSILVTLLWGMERAAHTWHGYLERGVWRRVP